jgi:thioredoxin 1
MSDHLKKLSEDAFEKGIEKGTFLVDFYADWCGPCRMLTPVLEKVAQEVQGQASIVKLDIDNAQRIASKYQITSVPTLILFKDGKEMGRLVGLREADVIKDFITSGAKI